MGIDSLPIIIQQAGYVENLAQVQEHSPAVQQTLNHQAALEFLQHQKNLVEQTEGSEASKKIKEKEKERKRNRNHASRKKLAQPVDAEVDDTDNITETDERNPWAGNIINRKI